MPTSHGDDKVQHSLSLLQQVYTGETFESIAYGLFDDSCDMPSYFKAWLAEGKPKDRDTAAAISQNTNLSLALMQLILDEMGTVAARAASDTTQQSGRCPQRRALVGPGDDGGRHEQQHGRAGQRAEDQLG